MRRSALLERLELELELQRGLRLLLLCFCMFAAVIYASVVESQSAMRLGLLQTYKSLFHLDDSLADIKTNDDLFDYPRHISSQAQLIQPLSSHYFVEESSELKVMQGIASFSEKKVVEVQGLTPRIDSPSWSMMAWVQLDQGTGANILRKPLGPQPDEIKLSCWAWHVGKPAERFDFGAHGEP